MTDRLPIAKMGQETPSSTGYSSSDKSNIKCVLVGDTVVGKTCLSLRLASNEFNNEYSPTMFDNYAVTTIVENKPYVLSLFDTAGQDEYNRLRALAYLNCDVYLVCFSVARPDTLHRVIDVWVPEITHFSPDTPFILVGTQIDKRDSETDPTNSHNYVQTKEGIGAATKIGARCYVECSALTEEGILRLKEASIDAGLSSHTKTRSDSTCGCAGACTIV